MSKRWCVLLFLLWICFYYLMSGRCRVDRCGYGSVNPLLAAEAFLLLLSHFTVVHTVVFLNRYYCWNRFFTRSFRKYPWSLNESVLWRRPASVIGRISGSWLNPDAGLFALFFAHLDWAPAAGRRPGGRRRSVWTTRSGSCEGAGFIWDTNLWWHQWDFFFLV